MLGFVLQPTTTTQTMTKQSFGPIMLDVAGPTLSEHERDILNHPNTGAVILFSRNYDNPEQVTELINSIRAARAYCDTALP